MLPVQIYTSVAPSNVGEENVEFPFRPPYSIILKYLQGGGGCAQLYLYERQVTVDFIQNVTALNRGSENSVELRIAGEWTSNM